MNLLLNLLLTHYTIFLYLSCVLTTLLLYLRLRANLDDVLLIRNGFKSHLVFGSIADLAIHLRLVDNAVLMVRVIMSKLAALYNILAIPLKAILETQQPSLCSC